tara:strand:- start:3928 stop:4248 length:321 start_codon:yes stop_codon:yes gene_type:complete
MKIESCEHMYSKSMDEPRPRLCVKCKEPEACDACLHDGDIHMCGKKSGVDLKFFKNYVLTYKETDFHSADCFIQDMLYGIGLTINKERYSHLRGFKAFKKYLNLDK